MEKLLARHVLELIFLVLATIMSLFFLRPSLRFDGKNGGLW